MFKKTFPLEARTIFSPLLEFKTKSHKDDVESVFLVKENELIKMKKIASDNSYDYYQKIITIDTKNAQFEYCFLYKDGSENLYLLDGEFSKNKEESKFFK